MTHRNIRSLSNNVVSQIRQNIAEVAKDKGQLPKLTGPRMRSKDSTAAHQTISDFNAYLQKPKALAETKPTLPMNRNNVFQVQNRNVAQMHRTHRRPPSKGGRSQERVQSTDDIGDETMAERPVHKPQAVRVRKCSARRDTKPTTTKHSPEFQLNPKVSIMNPSDAENVNVRNLKSRGIKSRSPDQNLNHDKI